MKKLVLGIILGILLIGILSVGLVFAEENNTGNQTNNNQTTTNITCTDTCSILNYTCGTQTVCNASVNCGSCGEDKVCQNGKCVEKEDNETADEDENETEVQVCSTITNKILCEARKNCEYNEALGKCLRVTKIKKLKETLQAYLNSTECPEDCTCAGSTIKCETENGRVMTVVTGKSGNVIIITKTANASTTVVLIKNATGVYGNFSGKWRKVKYLPDEIKEIVLKKLKMKNCSNCTIELKQDGTYLMNIEGKYRILGIFPKRVVSVTQIDSGTGEIILIKRPWWRFLAIKGKE